MSGIKKTTVVPAESLSVGSVLADGEFRRIETITTLRQSAAGVHFTTNASENLGAGEYFYPNGRMVAVLSPSRV